MKKRLKGLACWWLVLIMLVSALATPAMAASYGRVLVYTGTAALTSGDIVGSSDISIETEVSEGDNISELVTSSDSATLVGWNVWSSNYDSGTFTYEIIEKKTTNIADWVLSDTDLSTYGRYTNHIFEPLYAYSANIDVYTGDERLDWWDRVDSIDVNNRPINLGSALNQQDSLSDRVTNNLIGWKLWKNDSSGLIRPEFIAADGTLSASDINIESLLEAAYATAGVARNSEPLKGVGEAGFDYEGADWVELIYLDLDTPLNEQSAVLGALVPPAGEELVGWKLWRDSGSSGFVEYVEDISPKEVPIDYIVTYEDVTTIGKFDAEYNIILEPQWMLQHKIDPQPTSDVPTVGVKEYNVENDVWTDITDDPELRYQWYEESIGSYYLDSSHTDLVSGKEAEYSNGAWYLEETWDESWPVILSLDQGTTVRVETVGSTEVAHISFNGNSLENKGEYWELTLSEPAENYLEVFYNDEPVENEDGVKIQIIEKGFINPVSGQITKTLTAGEDGTYACKVTLPNGFVLTSDAVEWEVPEIVEYPVTLNANGGTINSGNITSYIAGEETALPTDVTKAGYRFDGWYEDESFAGDAVTQIESTDTGDKAYFAKWILNAPTVSAVSGYSGKYDGASHEISVTVSTVSGIDYSYQWYKGGKEEANKIADAASAEYPVKNAADSDTYYCKVTATDGVQPQTAWSDAVTVLVEKRSVTLTSATEQKVYDGTPLENDDVTVTGDGFVSDEGAEYVVTGTQKYVGSSENTFTYELTDGTNADNYEITTEPGTLTVTNRTEKYQITVEANSGTFEYNNAEHTVSGLKQTVFEVGGNTYTVSGLTATASGTDAGTISVTITGTAVVLDVNNENVTDQFEITTQNGTLTITKANENAITGLSIEGWTYGEAAKSPSASATFGTPSFTYVGTGDTVYTESTTPPENAGTYKVIAKVAETTNYAGASDEKEFTIAKATPVVTAPTAKTGLVYNRADQILAEAGSTTIGTLEYSLDNETWTDTVPTGKDAGEYTVYYKVTGNANCNEVSAQSITVHIAKANPVQNPEKLTTARVAVRKKLADATVTAGEFLEVDNTTVLEGTLTWVDDTEIINNDTTKKMKFTPADSNYAEIEFDVEVDSYTTGSSTSNSGTARYTVKFETNGGSDVASKSVTRNSKIAEPTAPTKEGFTFAGWYADKELTTVYDFDSAVTKNITLYAKWEEEIPDDEPEDTNNTDTHDCLSKEFDDLDISAWYHLNTDYVLEHEIFKGVEENIFEPNSPQTRAMMVTVLYRIEGEPEVSGTATFEDVDADAYYAKAVVWGQQNGIIKGYSETMFAPDQYIIREQIVTIMYRYAQYKGYDVSVGENTNILSYDDFDSISEYAIPAMQYAVGSGLVQGKTASTLNPLDNATRAEVAAMLHRFIEANK